jgi:hypothetical protein
MLINHVGELLTLLNTNQITDCEFVACYILLHSCFKAERNHWNSGIISPPLQKFSTTPKSLSISKIPGITLCRKLSPHTEILDVLKFYNIKGIKRSVNESLLNWSISNRPYILLFHVPTSRDVHEMMMRGERCITVFSHKETIQLVIKEQYPPFVERDALSFTLHDVKHMEQFIDPLTYYGQVFINVIEDWFFKSLQRTCF